MRVLYVDHTGELGGAEHSLLTLLAGLPADVEPIVMSPPGPLRERVRALGIQTLPIAGTNASFRLHPLHTPLALAQLAHSALAVRRAASRLRADLIHANSVRAGLVVAPGSALRSPPSVVHVRDVLPPGAAASATRRAVAATAARTICISEYVAQRFSAGAGTRNVVVPNGVDMTRFGLDTAGADRRRVRRDLGVGPDEILLGVVAQITPWKGQDDAIAALASVRKKHPRTRLVLVGEAKFVGRGVRHDNQAFSAALRAQADRLGVADAVHMTGERTDVPALLAALDVALVPSWEEPFGRSVIEAMAMERAVVATSVGGTNEIIEHGRTGLLMRPRHPDEWSAAIDGLIGDAPLRATLGANARASLAGRYDQATSVQQTLAVYRDVLSARR